jgi:hypothetical protein
VKKDLTRLMADNDQDRAACDKWMSEASPADVAAVWNAAQQDYKSPVMELLSRFAALAIGEAMVRKMQREATK